MSNIHRDDWNEDWAIVDGAGYHDIQVKIYSLFKSPKTLKIIARFLNSEQYNSCLDLKFFILFIAHFYRNWMMDVLYLLRATS